jgi:hypothetical protein
MNFSLLRTCGLAVAALVVCTATLTAETPQRKLIVDRACPVRLSNLSIHPSKLDFRYLNATDKDIAGIEFGAAYYDSVQEPHRVVVTGGWKGLRSGYRRESGLNISYWRTTNYSGWTLWPSKILYKDGTTWQIGTDVVSCGIESWNEKQLHRAYTPSQIMTLQPTDMTAMAANEASR